MGVECARTMTTQKPSPNPTIRSVFVRRVPMTRSVTNLTRTENENIITITQPEQISKIVSRASIAAHLR